MKQKLFIALHQENRNRTSSFSKILNVSLFAIIALSVVSTILLTFDGISTSLQYALNVFDNVIIVIFVTEYGLRVWTADGLDSENKWRGRKKYIFSAFGILDFLIIFPVIFPRVMGMNVKVLESMRGLRLLRILKLARYLESFHVLFSIIKERRAFLISTYSFVGIMLVIASMLMYAFEHEAQPDVFTNALSGIWWAVVTVTTVGYGDVVPITIMGKIVASVIAFLGIALVAIPTGVISTGLTAHFKDQHEITPHCKHCGAKLDDD